MQNLQSESVLMSSFILNAMWYVYRTILRNVARDEEQYSSHGKNLYIPPTKITKQDEIKRIQPLEWNQYWIHGALVHRVSIHITDLIGFKTVCHVDMSHRL